MFQSKLFCRPKLKRGFAPALTRLMMVSPRGDKMKKDDIAPDMVLKIFCSTIPELHYA
jgi:hypothetical protein